MRLRQPISGGGVNGSGIEFYSTKHSLIENNTIFDQAGAGGYWGAIFFKNAAGGASGGPVDSNEVRYNTLYDSYIGINLYHWASSNLVHHNTIYNCSQGITTHGGWVAYGASNSHNRIYNNTIYNCPIGLLMFIIGPDEGPIDDPAYFNNIVYNSATNRYGISFRWVNAADSARMTNFYSDYNCFYNSASTIVAQWGAEYGTKHNYTIAQMPGALGSDLHSYNINPVFSNPSNHEYYLTESSPEQLRIGGRGGAWPTYMGAIDPGDEPPPASIDQYVTRSSTQTTASLVDNLYGGIVPYDSLVLHWSTSRTSVLNLTARDTRATNTQSSYTFNKSSLTPNTKYYFRILAYDTDVIGDTTYIDSVTTTAIQGINQSISKNSTQSTVSLTDDLSNGNAPYDSLVLHWSTIRSSVANLTARDTRVLSASDPYTFEKTSLTADTKYYFRILAYDTGAYGDTSAIDSVNTTVPGLELISVFAPKIISPYFS